MEWVSDPEERKKIVARVRRKPWTGFLDRNKVEVLASRYGFPASFDLADRLSEVLWRYAKRSSKQLGSPFSPNELDAEAPHSMITAVHVGLWKAGNRSEFEVRKNRGGSVTAAAKAYRAIPLHRGRPPELWHPALLRSLGAIYEDGTGKKPSISRSNGKPYRGQGFNFACDVCQIANITLPMHHIREMEYRTRIRRNANTKAVGNPLNNALISFSKKTE